MRMRMINLNGVQEVNVYELWIQNTAVTGREAAAFSDKSYRGKEDEIVEIWQQLFFKTEENCPEKNFEILSIIYLPEGGLRFISKVGYSYDLFITEESERSILWNLYVAAFSANRKCPCIQIRKTPIYDILKKVCQV